MNPNGLFLANGISKRFGQVRALDGVTLTVDRETLTLLIGPNGSGKTTFIQVAGGLLEPDDGRILFEGRDVTRLPPHKRFELGIVTTFQIPRLFPSLSVLENILIASHRGVDGFFRLAFGRNERGLVDKAFEVLKLLSLERAWDKPASSLSGGQMKLLELARALMGEPKLLLLDEPLAGVNPTLVIDIMGRIAELRRRLGLTVLMVEHRLDLALKHADFVYVMHNGRVIAEGGPEEVLEHAEVRKAYLGE
ncbi:MAG: ABC transporter ATP-binding protein [Thermofilaceae archaeon]